MRRGRGRPSKSLSQRAKPTTVSSATKQHGGQPSPRVTSTQAIKTRGSRSNTPRKYYAMDSSDSDSDNDSISSRGSSISSTPAKKIRYVEPLRVVTPVNLAPSSDDLLLDPEHVLQALGIYEVLRHFRRIIRLSPFRFEDFCGAVKAPDQSSLLAQIHLALFRFLLSEDETSGLTFVASDEKDSFNIHMYCLGDFTWPDVIRSYIISDKTEFGDAASAVIASQNEDPFPFTSVKNRLKILHRLCDQFLASNSVRYDIMNEGMVESEDHCRNCCKMGDLLCCESCPAVYHLHCLKPPLEVVPDGDWLCPVCELHQLKGVTDCLPDWDRDGWLRNTPLGVDREGRKYWFMARRLFVEGNDEVLYYSCKAHLDELINSLEEDGKEKKLLSMIKAKYKVMIKQMEITETLTEELRGDLPSGLTRQRPRPVKRKEETTFSISKKEENIGNGAADPKKDVSEEISLSTLSEIKEGPAMEDNVDISEETHSPSATLTFVPDNDIKKIVTGPKVENPITPSSEKPMVLRDRKHSAQDSVYRRRRASTVLEHSNLSKADQSFKDTSHGEMEIDPDELLGKADVPLPGMTDRKNSVGENKTEIDCADEKLVSEKESRFPVTSQLSTELDGKSESEAQLSPASDIITKEIPESSEEGKKCSGTASSSSLTNIQSKNAVIKTEVSSSLPVKNAISTPSLKDSTVDPSKPDVKKESTSIDTVAKEVVEKPVFKLGQEGNYSSYVNQFTSNTLALNKQQQVDQRDKKRSVSHKFSLNEFKWHGDTCGSKEVILNTLRFSIVGVENSIPSAFMHPSWPVQRSTWVKAVHMSKTPKEFAAALSFLESSIRPICYLSVWNDAVGHVELRRVMSESRQAGIKKKDHREEEEEPELDPKGFVNYTWMPHHQIWKQKGEEYRLFGGGGWVWTSGLQCRKRKRPHDKKDTFVSKKRKLLDTTNKISAAKAEKRAEALKNEGKKTKAALQVTSRTVTVQEEKSLKPQDSLTASTKTAAISGDTASPSSLPVQTARLVTASTTQSSIQSTPNSSPVTMTQSPEQNPTVIFKGCSLNSSDSSATAPVPNATSSDSTSSVGIKSSSVQLLSTSQAHSNATSSQVAFLTVSSAVTTSSLGSSLTLTRATIQPVMSATVSVMAEPSSESNTVEPSTSSQAESSSNSSLSVTSSSDQKGGDNPTSASLSKTLSATNSTTAQMLPTIKCGPQICSISPPSSTSVSVLSSTSSLLSNSSDATSVTNCLTSEFSSANLKDHTISTISSISSSALQSPTETTAGLDLTSLSSTETEDDKAVDSSQTEPATTSDAFGSTRVENSGALESPSTLPERERGFAASETTKATVISPSRHSLPSVVGVNSSFTKDIGGGNNCDETKFLKKCPEGQVSTPDERDSVTEDEHFAKVLGERVSNHKQDDQFDNEESIAQPTKVLNYPAVSEIPANEHVSRSSTESMEAKRGDRSQEPFDGDAKTQKMSCVASEKNPRENKVFEIEEKGKNNSEKAPVLEDDLEDSRNVMIRNSVGVPNNDSSFKNDSSCTKSEGSLDKFNEENVGNTSEKDNTSLIENSVSPIASNCELKESYIESSQAGATLSAAPLTTQHQKDDLTTAHDNHCENMRDQAPEETICKDSTEHLTSVCHAKPDEVSESMTENVDVSSSSAITVLSTASVSQPLLSSLPEESKPQDEPMDVDVTSVSPTLKSSSVTSHVVSNALHSDRLEEKIATPEEISTKEEAMGIVRPSVCEKDVPSAVTSSSIPDIAESSASTMLSPVVPNTTSNSNSASCAVSSSQSLPKLSSLSGPTQGVTSTANLFVASLISAKAGEGTSIPHGVKAENSHSQHTLKPKDSIVNTVASVVNTVSAASVVNTLKGTSSQKILVTSRLPGQTTQYVPAVLKPILPSPKPPVQSTGTQGSIVAKISAQASSSGQSASAPVKSIAALVASLPSSAATITPSQLIRLVSSDGRSIILQGSQIAAALAQQAGSQRGLTSAKSITLQVSGAAIAHTRAAGVAKTVGATTSNAIITVQRPQQQAAQIKPQIVVKPKVVTKPMEEEKFPSLEPVIKDPRALLDRRLAKWPLRHSVKSVFALQKHDRRRLGRKAGMKEMSGYVYSSRAVGVNWPSGIPRPSFKVAWRFRTQSLKTLAGAALQLRVLQSCLKWDEMNIRPPRGNSNTVFTSSGTTTTEITNRKFVSADGLRCKYLVRKVVRTLTKPVLEPPKPAPTKSKRGRTLRPKIVLQPDDDDDAKRSPSEPIVLEAWYPEAKLELWEIRQYHERIERERALEREKKQQEEAVKRAAELRAAALQRKQQEQQARQQQQHLLKMNKKKVQNAIKTQQRKVTVLKPAPPSTTYKATVAPPVPPGVLRRTLPVVPLTVSNKIPGIAVAIAPPVRTQSPARTKFNTAVSPHVQRLQPKPTVTQRVLPTQVPSSQISGSSVPGTPIPARGTNPGNASRMKHSSKEQVKQASKAKFRKGGGVSGIAMLHNKKYMTMEARQDINRIAICRKVLDFILDKIERNEENERKREEKKRAKEESQALKLEKQKAAKLGVLLQKRKEALKKDMVRKRDLLERDLMVELQQNNPSKRKNSDRKNWQNSPEGPMTKKRKTEDEWLYCICKTPYDPAQFYVGCDMCANWFHGACVQVSPETAKNMDEWTCADCTQARRGVEEEELYCLCRQPYDERKFYIGCDKCQDWFHGACVGITAAEADNIEFYTCPRCSQSQAQEDKQPLTAREYDSLKRLLRSLQSHKMAWPFLEPVNPDDVPEYNDVIVDPIDLSTVEERMNSKAYPSLESFVSDITKIFDNCRYFNQRDSPYYRCAEVLESFFVQKLRAWKSKK
ncbi:nucleosome-remodeling factor subunit BPTF-like isoform X2 [Acropora millepora]|uniref:nucleosome-remodeling factor subunit BPTF-like isoform X2 n=1 Tax=Acropora millepora TaxID=45264 RepID=UPI001CF0E26B|nr:nucleosome-remodeling factor subunit BPTF-like isoform X2 [Acropora millepora]